MFGKLACTMIVAWSLPVLADTPDPGQGEADRAQSPAELEGICLPSV